MLPAVATTAKQKNRKLSDREDVETSKAMQKICAANFVNKEF